jgi:dihydroorotase
MYNWTNCNVSSKLRGIAAGVNAGLKMTKAYDGVCILANDILLPENWLLKWVNYSNLIPKTGIIGIHCVENLPPLTDGVHKVHTPFGDNYLTRELIDTIGGYNEEYDPYGMQDQDFAERANIAGFTNQNQHSLSADLLVNLFNYCKINNSHFLIHPEKVSLSKGGQIHQGKSALYCGFKGIPVEAETIALKEILDIAKYCSYAPVIIDLSTKESIDIVKNYRKEMDFKVGVSINNLIFNEDSVLDFDTNFKLNPPLRAKVDQDALLSALMDGTIDFVYTQHTPLTPEEKVLEFDLAENGNIGLQTSFQALIEKLGNSQIELISNVLSLNQSNYFNIDLGHFEEGKKGRFSIIDLNNPETFNLQNNKSLSKNSAFINKTFSTKIITTLN